MGATLFGFPEVQEEHRIFLTSGDVTHQSHGPRLFIFSDNCQQNEKVEGQ
jgi:hypothetical protein